VGDVTGAGMQNWLKTFIRNDNGNIAVIFAVTAVPLMVVASAAMDTHTLVREKSHVQEVLDLTALAIVADASLSDDEKKEKSLFIFKDNYEGKAVVELSPSVHQDEFTLTAKGDVKTTLLSIVGKSATQFKASSTAVLQDEGSICVLSLAENGPDRVVFTDTASFTSPNCAVHVNSDHVLALNNKGTSVPKAEGFCAAGGGRGKFDPPLNSECEVTADPYENFSAPSASACVSLDDAGALFGQLSTLGVSYLRQQSTDASEFFAGSNLTMTPGTYCGGLTVNGINVNFQPGTYIIKDGPLVFKNGSQAEALGVSFILEGNSTLTVELGADLKVTAPRNSDLAGIAFFQKPPVAMQGTLNSYPTATSTLASQGRLDVEGTLYFPTQALKITGDSYFGSQARATSFIAYEMEFSGEAISTVAVDYRAAGLPPLEPRTTGGPRLIE